MTGLFYIYNIHNDTAESEHKIHLQKALLILGKNSVSIIFTLSQAVPPLDGLSYHLHFILAGSHSHHRCPTGDKRKTNGDIDATTGSQATMKHAEHHTSCRYSVAVKKNTKKKTNKTK